MFVEEDGAPSLLHSVQSSASFRLPRFVRGQSIRQHPPGTAAQNSRPEQPFRRCSPRMVVEHAAQYLQEAEQADHGVDEGLDYGPREKRGA